MNKIKQLNFVWKVIYCGLDVHKTNWKINAKMEGLEVAAFSQDPDPLVLKNDKMVVRGISKRRNEYLREAITDL